MNEVDGVKDAAEQLREFAAARPESNPEALLATARGLDGLASAVDRNRRSAAWWAAAAAVMGLVALIAVLVRSDQPTAIVIPPAGESESPVAVVVPDQGTTTTTAASQSPGTTVVGGVVVVESLDSLDLFLSRILQGINADQPGVSTDPCTETEPGGFFKTVFTDDEIAVLRVELGCT